MKNPSLINREGDLTEIYLFRPLSDREVENYQEIFYGSLLYIESKDEYEPVRVMKSSFQMPDGSFYELELRISVLERDDMVKAVWSYLGVHFVFLFLCLIVGMHRILRNSGDSLLDEQRVFQRFYRPDLRKKNSTGLGLAIVKLVADFYGFSISYHYNQKHIFRLNLS